MTTKNFFLSLLLAAMMCVPFTAKAQVTMGAATPPQSFSVLELISNNAMGLRLPQITYTAQRYAISEAHGTNLEMRGLQIFVMETRCIYTWNGEVWIQECGPGGPYVPSVFEVYPTLLEFAGSGGTQTVTVTTDMPGWTVSGAPAWLSISESAASFQVTAVNNNLETPRRATLTVTAGSFTGTVEVVQFGTIRGFVGAFWRDHQRGERLIRINNPGGNESTWSVLTHGDWIVLCGEDFPHPPAEIPVYTSDTQEVMEGTSEIRDRTGEIRFRIGLNEANPNDGAAGYRAPRWGRVEVQYGTNQQFTHTIWVRQGEAAHYVMRPEDLMPNGAERPAARWSPFNLTAYTLNAQVGTRAQQANQDWVGNRSRFTQFPSQAGAFFQWAMEVNFNPRRAFAPTGSYGDSWFGQYEYHMALGFWNTLADEHETCPPGWRRPDDGATDTWSPNDTEELIRQSEMRQSLILTPVVGNFPRMENTVWGFYADGFFDRHTLTGSWGVLHTAAGETNDVAYAGRLFFNPITGYHLFFPAAGTRNVLTGIVLSQGLWGYYFSSSLQEDPDNPGSESHRREWQLQIAAHQIGFVANQRMGLSIRCVVE